MPSLIVSLELQQQLGAQGGIITGVVRKAEVSKDRRLTILEIVIGENEPISLLINGGADVLVGRLVIIDCKQRNIYEAVDARMSFRVTTALSGPDDIIGKGGPLSPPISKLEMQRLRNNIEHGVLSNEQHKLLERHRQHKFQCKWTIHEILTIVPLLKVRDQDLAIHHVSIVILERAEIMGDFSSASKLAALLPDRKQQRLISWFIDHSPISIRVEKDRVLAHMKTPKAGKRRPFRLALARTTPI